MKALLLKDYCVLWKQLRFFLLFILIFSALPGGFNGVFAVTYAALLPYSCIAYDERSKWDQLAAMMPYTARDLVLSRYVLGWIAAAGACALSLVLQGVFSTLLDTGFYPVTLVLAFFACLATLAITLPLIFRFGVERGRLLMFLIIFLVCGSAGALGGIADATSGLPPAAVWLLLPVSLVLTVLSVPLSIRWYAHRYQ